ncbi:MAG: DUF4157 domain-containing protein [Deltaproteobacteria bacterium]|nr:DUF4157 domain-containing protein [Deltaproteobacteria bacterium]
MKDNCSRSGDEEEIRLKPISEQITPVIQRKDMAAASGVTPDTVSGISSLQGGGRPLSESSRAFFEPRFGADFSGVRIHEGSSAAYLAQSVNARAFTLGRDVVFGTGQYEPHSREGKSLMAHELAHVAQQGHAGPALRDHYIKTKADKNTIYRADPGAVGRTMALGITPGTGLQFYPTNVTDTRVGPVTIAGGLRYPRAGRLNIIIGANLTFRMMARLLLPLWTTATPFTAPGATAPVPLDIIDEEILAKGLMAYNRYYLRLPNMNRWQAGLRFPLPVLIDEVTGVATLHPGIIRTLSTGFEAAWLPLLDTPATATAAVAPATLTADVRAFLARETDAGGRGIHLTAQAKTNAIAALPFIRETFRQLGAGRFDVALSFMNWMVNRGISLLAAQRDGAAILAEIRTALAAAPATLSAEQQSNLRRANLMLGLVAGVAAQAPPGARRTRAEKTVVVDTLKLVGSTHNPSTQIAVANSIFSQCNVRIQHGVNADDSRAAAPFTTTWLGGDTDLRSGSSCGSVTAEERRMYRGGRAEYGMGTGKISAYFVATVTGIAGGGFSCSTRAGTHALNRRKSVVNNSGSLDTLAHELGHQLIDRDSLERHTLPGIMHGRPRATVTLSDAQCNRIYHNA